MFIHAKDLLEGDVIVGPVSGSLREVGFVDVTPSVVHIWWAGARPGGTPNLTIPAGRKVRTALPC